MNENILVNLYMLILIRLFLYNFFIIYYQIIIATQKHKEKLFLLIK